MEKSSFADDLRAGLCRAVGQKQLPSKYLYDKVGSALFEVICVLPEYGLTRADSSLLEQHAPEWATQLPMPTVVAELGSGSSKKTRLILEPLARRQPTSYFPIDISASALAQCARELSEVSGLQVSGLNAEYLDGLRQVAARCTPTTHLLVLFLGSTIGNFDRGEGEALLRDIRGILRPGDHLLLSSDLVKPEATLLLAYDDPAGVTAAFNKNLLCRINRELGGTFDIAEFEHLARWNSAERRIEMHLQARADMDVRIRSANLTVHFHKGESIKTEDCYKYTADEIIRMGQRSGFVCESQWVAQADWPFAQTLLRAAGS